MRWTPFFQLSELVLSHLFAALAGIGVERHDWFSAGVCAVFGIGSILGAAESIVRRGWLGRRA